VFYDPATQKAEVLLGALKTRITASGELPNLPLPVFVPVHWTRTVASYVTLPLAPLDTGYVLISDRSLEKWLELGVPTDPGLRHTHSEIDGIFHPGLHSDLAPIVPPTSQAAAVIESPLINLGAAAVEPVIKATTFIALMDTMFAAASAATVPNDGGAASFAAFQGAWDAAKATINSARVKTV